MINKIFKQTIEFLPSSQEVFDFVEPPQPSKSFIPEWYKQGNAFDIKNIQFKNQEIVKPLKSCVPFLDALTAGYIQSTWSDLIISSDSQGARYKWLVPPQIMEHRETPVSLPIPEEYANMEFHWKIPWIVRLPKNYSLLITHPLNRVDLPFFTLTGIIDADEFHHIRFGNIPFYIKKNFSGVIPSGTPIFQIIPFKRENWSSKTQPFNQINMLKKEYSFSKKLIGEYKDKFWKKKKYE